MVKIQLSDIWTFYRFCAFAEKVGINKSWSYKSRIKTNQSFLQTLIFIPYVANLPFQTKNYFGPKSLSLKYQGLQRSWLESLKELSFFATNYDSTIGISFQPNSVNLWYFKLFLFDLKWFIVWSISGFQHSNANIYG